MNRLLVRIGLFFKIRTIGNYRGIFVSIRSIRYVFYGVLCYFGFKLYVLINSNPVSFDSILPLYFGPFEILFLGLTLLAAFFNGDTRDCLTHVDSYRGDLKKRFLRSRYVLPKKNLRAGSNPYYEKGKTYITGLHEIDFINNTENIKKLIKLYEDCLEETKEYDNYGSIRWTIGDELEFLYKLQEILK